MISFSTTQLHELLRHLDAMQGIVTQVLNQQVVPVKRAGARKAKPKYRNAKITSATFRYNHALQHDRRIARLYQRLLHAEWIAKETSPEDFCAIFSGEPSPAKIKWIGTQQHLFYLIRTMADRQLITIPHGTGIWQITENHFLNKNSRPFRNFNKQKEPVRAKAAIDQLVDILDPVVS